ncbi:tetratricopeptide repeat protein [Botrimarina colliarenosi]|uniref:Tetratricopeptide repeat protein n=1 Tax=Botrimarina colliarenosi TaxID=2528001 RepID=A0A5C6AD19_9BACT|nr:tetratricopeptide repeat protein [Botrimarina colliarenosi]TWT97065.1 tetratricopeptide repeat protein [Botrimarina colliarenosi]
MTAVIRSLLSARIASVLAALLLLAAGVAPAIAQSSDDANTQVAAIGVEALIGDSVSNPSDARYSDVAEAIQRFRNRDQLSARTFLERAVQKNPKLPPVGVMLAKLQLLSGNAAAVRPALEQAVQEDSAGDPEPYLLLAEEALAGQRTIEADALFDKAVQLINDYSANAKRKRQFEIRAYRGRAIIGERRKDWEQAESDLRKWIEQDPDEASAQQRLGQVLFQYQTDEKDRQGFEAFTKAKQLNKELPSPYVSAALMYSRNGKTARAMEAFEKAFRESGTDQTTLIAYAQALVKANQLDKAESVLKKARDVAPDADSVWLLSGVAARMAGDSKAAEQYLMKALSLSPSNRDILNQLALTLLESGDEGAKARALQFAQLNQQLNQNNPDINVTLAWVLYQNGDARNATTALRQGLQGGALSPDGSFLLAKVLLERDDKTNAKRLLESALKSDQGIFVERKEAEQILSTL